jgi:hypothetical protein
MRTESKQVPVRVERIVALFVLDHPDWRSRSELEGELHNIDREAVSAALEGLAAQGVIVVEGEQVSASKCVRHLDVLGLIAV